MAAQTLFKSQDLQVDLFRGAEQPGTLAVTFTPFDNRTLEGAGFGSDFLLKNGFDVLAFKSVGDTWFQNVPSALLSELDEKLAAMGYARRVAYGSSMGGYAAIQFSKVLRFETVLAYSPQFRIDLPFDTRWKPWADRIRWQYRISRDSVDERCQYFIVYDDRGPDGLHVEFLSEILPPASLRKVVLPFAGHPVGQYLLETGRIQLFTLDVLRRGHVDAMRRRQDRRQSRAYFENLSAACARKRKHRWALSLIDTAIRLQPGLSRLHQARSHTLDRLGRLDDAIEAARTSVSLVTERDDAGPQQNLAALLFKKGHWSESLEAIDIAIKRYPGIASFHALRSAALQKLQRLGEAIDAAKVSLSLDASDIRMQARLSEMLRMQAAPSAETSAERRSRIVNE